MKNMKQRFSGFLGGRNFASAVFVAIVIAAVVLVNVICTTLTEALGLYIYPQQMPDFTISDTFSEVFAEAEERGESITVTFCMEEEDLKLHSTGSYVYETAKKFKEKYGDFITLRYINLVTMYDGDGNDVSEELKIYEKDMRGVKQSVAKSTVIFRSGDNYKVLTDYTSGVGFVDFFTLDSEGYVTSYRGEEVFASMMNWVLVDDHGVAYFTVGHGETANQPLYTALTCAGYYVDTINLRDRRILSDSSSGEAKKLSVSEMMEKLDEADLILISNPTSDFERAAEGSGVTAELDLLDYYAEGGGSFFVTVDPYSPEAKMKNFFGFLRDFGIEMFDYEDGDRVVRQTVQDLSNGLPTDSFTLVTEFGEDEKAQQMKNLLGDSRVILRDVSPLKLSGKAVPLLVTSEDSKCYAGGEVTDTSGGYAVAAYSEMLSQTGKTAELFFIPSVYLTATDAMVTNGYGNKDFVYALFDVLYGMDDMPYGTNSIVYDDTVLENLTMGTAKGITAVLLAIPCVIAIAGAVVLIRRKNR